MKANNRGYEYTVPACLKPGYYLVRHELIALHAAVDEGKAQFYPSCHQIELSGSGTTMPTNLVSFPGAYKPTDPGILFNVYSGM